MRSFAMPASGQHRFHALAGPIAWRKLAMAGLVVAIVAATSVFAGLLTVMSAGFAEQRPVLLLALPMLIVLAFGFVLAPRVLVCAILLLRAAVNPVFEGAQLPGIGGLGGLVNLAVIALAFALLLREPRRVPRVAWMIWLPFMFFQFVGLTYAPDRLPALRLFLGQLATMAVFILAFLLVDGWASLDRMLKLIVAGSVPVAVYTLVGIARGETAVVEGVDVAVGRYSGPFTHPNMLAFYVVLVMGVLLYLWKSPRSKAGWLVRGATMGYMLVLLALLFATKTRSAWVSAAALFFLYGLLVERRFLLYLALAPLLAMLVPDVRERVLDLQQGNEVVQYARLNSFAWRKLIWTDGLSWMQPSHYVLGYGAGAFLYFSPIFFSLAGGHSWGAHSVLVQLFFDSGVVGAVAYLLMFWQALAVIVRLRRHDRVLTVIFGALVISYLIISLSDNMLAYLVFNWYFWFAVGVVLSMALRVPVVEASASMKQRPSSFASRRYGSGLR